MDKEFKPCPFCGGEVKESFGTLGAVYCKRCDYAAPDYKWNTRPLEDGFRDALEKVSGALNQEIHTNESLLARIDELVPQCNAAYAPYREKVHEARAEVEYLKRRLDDAVLRLTTPELEEAHKRIAKMETALKQIREMANLDIDHDEDGQFTYQIEAVAGKALEK